MTSGQIPLMQQTISMLTDKIDKVTDKVEEEARKAQLHREESLKFHADLLDKLETKFAGKWTEKVLIFIGT
jgi:phage shock protein A